MVYFPPTIAALLLLALGHCAFALPTSNEEEIGNYAEDDANYWEDSYPSSSSPYQMYEDDDEEERSFNPAPPTTDYQMYEDGELEDMNFSSKPGMIASGQYTAPVAPKAPACLAAGPYNSAVDEWQYNVNNCINSGLSSLSCTEEFPLLAVPCSTTSTTTTTSLKKSTP